MLVLQHLKIRLDGCLRRQLMVSGRAGFDPLPMLCPALGLYGDTMWVADERFELYVANSPIDMEAWLYDKNNEG